MDAYDPYEAPEPDVWLELDESERIHLVRSYHRRAGIKIPNPELHAATHVIVENQLAAGEPVVQAAYSRLRDGGLDRHDAIHAIGQVLANTIHAGLTEGGASDLNSSYLEALRGLTAERWLKQELE